MDTEYVLVDKYDNITNRAKLSEGIDPKNYFMQIKKIDEEGFNKIWKVMTIDEFDNRHKHGLQNRQIEWWREEDGYLDGEMS